MNKAKKSTCEDYAIKVEGPRPIRICLLARSVLTRSSKVLTAVIVVLVVSACATRSMEHLDQHMVKADQPQFNSIIESDGGQFFSFGKVLGPAVNPLEPADLSRAMGFDIDGVSVTIWDPRPVGADYALPGFFDADAEWHDDSVQAALQTMRATLAPMEAFTRTKTAINVVVAPAGSGLWVRQPLDFAMGGAETWVIVGYSDRVASRRSEMVLWARISKVFNEHVMRLQQLFRWPDLLDEQRGIDFDAAVELAGWCGSARFMLYAFGEGSVEMMPGPKSNRLFPGLLEGYFSPDLDALKASDSPSIGAEIARALIFHLFSGGDGNVDIANENEVVPMLKFCDQLSLGIPAFSSGQTRLTETEQ